MPTTGPIVVQTNTATRKRMERAVVKRWRRAFRTSPLPRSGFTVVEKCPTLGKTPSKASLSSRTGTSLWGEERLEKSGENGTSVLLKSNKTPSMHQRHTPNITSGFSLTKGVAGSCYLSTRTGSMPKREKL